MRLRENEIDLVAHHVVEVLRRGEYLILDVPESELLDLVRRAIVEDLLVEETLNREVEDILRGHAKELETGSIDYRTMFSKVKDKLVRERNLILS